MNYKSIFFGLVLSFVLTYILVPLNKKLAISWKIVDHPHDRGIHLKSTPLAGGLSFGIAIILGLLAYYFFHPQNVQILYLAIADFFVLILGLFDDKYKIRAITKLIFQIIIISFIYFTGLRMAVLTNPLGEPIALGFLSYPLTLIWFLLVMNGLNLIDGLDGLAAGICLIVATVLAMVGFQFGNYQLTFMAVLIIGSMLAFLKYNFYPAEIFMGDTGSLFLGFNIAAISIAGNAQYKGITAMTILIPIIALFIPLFDTGFAIFRRIKNKKHIFQADKEHLHHRLLKLGLGQATIAIIGYFITFLFGLVAFGFSLASKEYVFILLVFMVIILFGFFLILFKRGEK